ncbi:MAG: hypothetical protein ACFFDJ_04640 [Candidatus Odinarchaeota archaeon]
MRIKVAGFILTLFFGIIMAYVISMGLPSVVLVPPAPIPLNRFVQPDIVYEMIHRLGDMLWHYRGIDMVLQAVFLFVAALAASAFFHEAPSEASEKKEKE